jgi:uncharacterized protein (TIGR00251 family)
VADASPLEPTDGGTLLRVKVVPGSSRDRIAGPLGNRLKVQVAAAPEAGKANAALCALLAKVMGVSRRDITLTAGRSQPAKTLRIAGLTVDQTAARLGLQ